MIYTAKELKRKTCFLYSFKTVLGRATHFSYKFTQISDGDRLIHYNVAFYRFILKLFYKRQFVEARHEFLMLVFDCRS